MMKDDLAQKLHEMRESADHGELTMMTLLFGVVFVDEIKSAGGGAAVVAAYDARYTPHLGDPPAVTDGMKLATVVTPKEWRRWRTPPVAVES